MLYETDPMSWQLDPGPATPPDDARIALVQDQSLLSVDAEYWQAPTTQTALGYIGADAPLISLGHIAGHHWYAADWPEGRALPHQWSALGARDVLLQSEAAFAVASRATQLITWRRQHQHCGQCGGLTTAGEGEHYRWCGNCRIRFYPRINPCIIVLVTQGDQVLLAQGTRHRTKGWYSTLAGFMEPGESAEQAVHREVFEEVGVNLTNLRYIRSQTWPFPHQLMLGFIADYADGEIHILPAEIADAQWWSVDQLPQHPPAQTISGFLIHHYLNERKHGN